MTIEVLLVLSAYLFGSVSSAVLMCRALRLPDPRASGSLNPGATNVLRIGGRPAAAMTLAGDFLKGALPVSLVLTFGASAPLTAAVGVAAFLGHLFPVFFGFRGGKGVATGLGVLLGWSWQAFLGTVGVWLLIAALFRYSSLAGMSSFVLAALWLWLLGEPPTYVLGMLIVAGATLWRHQSNIRNLLDGTEKKLGEKG